jgi:hypothetical protein
MWLFFWVQNPQNFVAPTHRSGQNRHQFIIYKQSASAVSLWTYNIAQQNSKINDTIKYWCVQSTERYWHHLEKLNSKTIHFVSMGYTLHIMLYLKAYTPHNAQWTHKCFKAAELDKQHIWG